MSTQVKICGITTLDQAMDCMELGADYLGFNFYPDSPRFLTAPSAREIMTEVPSTIGKVGVFVNADPQLVIDVATELNLDLLQFHGDETPEYCRQFARPYMKAHRFQNESELEGIENFGGDYVLVDAYVENAYGGTGVTANWDLARKAKEHFPLFLSGGLNVDNVEVAIQAVKPFAVDVASGVESEDGSKSYRKIEEFIKKAKRALG
jgi:phosphoribosylanthranilate isomerase